jgi:hypothetical protein
MPGNIGGGRAPPERERRLAGTKAAHLKNTRNIRNASSSRTKRSNLQAQRASEARRFELDVIWGDR